MLRSTTGPSVRFTSDEIEQSREVGLDLAGARTRAEVEQAVAEWAQTLQDERPLLLEKIVEAMAHAKGVAVPQSELTKLSSQPDGGFPRQS